MKKVMVLLNITFIMSSCISAAPVAPQGYKRTKVVVSEPVKPVSPKRSKVVKVKKVVVGTRVSKLPSKQVTVYYNNLPFLYADGVFYKKLSTSTYEVVKPEIGMVVSQLPDFNVETVCINGETLFLFDGTLYKQIPTSQGVKYKVSGFIN